MGTNTLDKQTLTDLVAEHGSFQKVAEHLGVSRSLITRLCNKYGIKSQYKPRGPRMKDEPCIVLDEETLTELIAEHHTFKRVARHVGVTHGAISRLCKKYGIKSQYKPKGPKTQDEEEEIPSVAVCQLGEVDFDEIRENLSEDARKAFDRGYDNAHHMTKTKNVFAWKDANVNHSKRRKIIAEIKKSILRQVGLQN